MLLCSRVFCFVSDFVSDFVSPAPFFVLSWAERFFVSSSLPLQSLDFLFTLCIFRTIPRFMEPRVSANGKKKKRRRFHERSQATKSSSWSSSSTLDLESLLTSLLIVHLVSSLLGCVASTEWNHRQRHCWLYIAWIKSQWRQILLGFHQNYQQSEFVSACIVVFWNQEMKGWWLT